MKMKAETIKRLLDVSDLVLQDIGDQDTGWYYQFNAALKKAEQEYSQWQSEEEETQS